MRTKKVSTYCPIFTGFYNTIFDESDSFIECELNCESDFRERFTDEYYPGISAVPWDFIRENFWDCIDYRAANLAVAQYILDAIPGLLPDFVKSAEFERVVSPKEYNFANDGIDCVLELDIDAIRAYLAENADAWADYLKASYTSRSGFMSSYPNTPEEWAEDTEDFSEIEGHYAGSILNFIAGNEMEDPQMDLYYAANGSEAFSNGANLNIQKLIDEWAEKES
jgi:hypothetical protein